MNTSRKIFDFYNLYFILFICLITLSAWMLRKYGYDSIFTTIALITLVISGLTLVVTASIYGFLEKKYKNEESPVNDTHVIEYFRRVNRIFLLAQAICTICVFSIFCLLMPNYGIILLILFAFFAIIDKVKKRRKT